MDGFFFFLWAGGRRRRPKTGPPREREGGGRRGGAGRGVSYEMRREVGLQVPGDRRHVRLEPAARSARQRMRSPKWSLSSVRRLCADSSSTRASLCQRGGAAARRAAHPSHHGVSV